MNNEYKKNVNLRQNPHFQANNQKKARKCLAFSNFLYSFTNTKENEFSPKLWK